MRTIIKSTLIVLAILLAGCSQNKRDARDNRVSITGSGNLVEREESIIGFDRIEAGFAFNVTVRQGEEYRVAVSVDDNLAEYLQVEKQGTTLHLGFDPNYAYDIPHATMQAEVTMPELLGVQLNGSSHVTLVGFSSAENLKVDLSGSSSLTGDLAAESSSFTLTGSTYLQLVGFGKDVQIDACGNSVVDLAGYRVEGAAVETSCASTVVVNVDGRLDVDASQNARVFYLGHAVLGDAVAYEYASVNPK